MNPIVRDRQGEIVAVAGLVRVTHFLYDTNSLGDLSHLKGRTVTAYSRGFKLTGIGVEVK